jgi:hypothetical protein
MSHPMNRWLIILPVLLVLGFGWYMLSARLPPATRVEPAGSAAPADAAKALPPPVPAPTDAAKALPPPAPAPAPAVTPEPAPDIGTAKPKRIEPRPTTAIPPSALPAFPWPPPRTTARYDVPRDLATARGRVATLGAVADHLEAALQSQGYTQLSYYGVPEGFALVTQVEQITEDGRPAPPPGRWEAALQPVSLANFSVENYLKALVMARRGYYRIIVFVATPQPFAEDVRRRLSRDEADNLFHGGLSKLPATLRSVAYGADCNLTALIYEFEQQVPGRPARTRDSSPVTGEMHLKQAMILAALGTT